MELYKKLRPKRFKDMVGQEDAVRVLQSLLNKGFPHFVLFSGPSGVGKTTAARILRRKLGCSQRDFHEINAADANGVGDVRKIKARMTQSPGPDSKCKIYLMDEAERLTGDAQGALLKMLEDTPDHVFFIMCTTNPGKLRKEIHNRGSHIHFKAVSRNDMKKIITKAVQGEDTSLSKKVLDKIIEIADGSPRKALVLLDQVIGLHGWEGQLNALESSDIAAQGFNIAQALIYRKPWSDVAKMIKTVEEEPETVRRIILGYATTVILGGSKFAPRAYLIIESFRDNFYDSGKAGLAASCFDVVHTK
jgi:DNA polymerase III gamma/tau subunit